MGIETVLRFFEHHNTVRPNNNLRKLRAKTTEQGFDASQTALVLLQTKIEMRGYKSTYKFIDSYLEQQKSLPVKSEEKRKAKREKVAGNPLQVVVVHGGVETACGVIEYNVDGSGLYLATENTMNLKNEVRVEFSDFSIEAVVVHKNILQSSDAHNVGCGIHIEDEKTRSDLAQYLETENSL